MAKIYDVSKEIDNEFDFIKVSEDKEFKINDDVDSVLKVYEIYDKNENIGVDVMFEIFEILIGKDATEYVKKNYRFKNFKKLFTEIMKAVQGEDENEGERFQ